MMIKLWNWDKLWACQQVFEGHTHYVMQIVINPKDNNTFASASLDRTIKVRRRRRHWVASRQGARLINCRWNAGKCVNWGG